MLVDRARPERLGELARHLIRERPDTEVLTEAPALASLPEGSAAILCARASDAGWLNQERPVVQARALRLVLFSDDATTVHFAREAVDFYDWISHRIDRPEGPPAFAVRALRRTACARANAVAWGGGDLEGSFARALPGRRLERVSAGQPYPALVEALAPRARTWVAIEGGHEVARLRRVRWGMAEAGRLGRTVLVEPRATALWTALPRAHARALAVEEAARLLRRAGIEKAATLAAVLELEPETLQAAARLVLAGMAETELFGIALREEDPGPVLEELVRARGLLAAAEQAAEDKGVAQETEALGRFQLPDWPARIEMALDAGELDLAAHWAEGWKAATRGDARSTAALARIRAMSGAVDEGRTQLEEARCRAGSDVDEATLLELSRAEGFLLTSEGRFLPAIGPLQEALRLAERLERPQARHEDLKEALVRALVGARRLDEAEHVLAEWTATRSAEPLGPFRGAAIARLMLARHDVRGASRMLEQELERRSDAEHPSRRSAKRDMNRLRRSAGRWSPSRRVRCPAPRRHRVPVDRSETPGSTRECAAPRCPLAGAAWHG